MIKTAVVILNWNGLEFFRRFIPRVVEHSRAEGVAIYIADNASSDGSVEYIRDSYPEIEIIKFKKNHGFAEGYRKALKMIDAKYFILLNSDVEVSAGWLAPLISMMESNPQAAACMPTIRSYNNKDFFDYAGAAGGYIDILGYTFCRGRMFDSVEKDTNQYNNSTEIFWATGACICLRSETYFKAGELVPLFYAHMEEIDLCWRFKNMGYKIMYVPESRVYHIGGGSMPMDSPYKTYLNFRNNLILMLRNMRLCESMIKIPVRMFLDFFAAVLFLSKGNIPSFFAIVKAHFAFYFLLPRVLASREKSICRKKLKELNSVYKRSVVIDYFLGKKKIFSDLISQYLT